MRGPGMIAGAWIAASTALIGSAAVTGFVRRRALTAGRLDHPNERSSHSVPTPRGGGVGPVLCWLIIAALVGGAGAPSLRMPTLLAGVALIALIGWADDRWSLPVAPRLAGHLIAGFAIGLSLGGGRFPAAAIYAVAIAASVNFVNFMDGIDGLVASQVAIFAGTLWAMAWSAGTVSQLAAALAGAAIGFLFWNWPPARIFLGDVGSGGFGAIIVVLIGVAAAVRPELAWRASLPLVPLFVDAVATLLRRAVAGEAVWQAHRTHLYQELANGELGHRPTTLGFAALAVAGSALALSVRADVIPAVAVYVCVCLMLWLSLHRYVRRRAQLDRQ